MKMLRHLIILITLITCLVGFGNTAWAHVYWSPNGNDNNDGTTEAKAVKTWNRAFTLFKNNTSQWIVVCGTLSNVGTINGYINSTTNARIIRKNSWGGRMFSGTLETSNVTIDGRGVSGSYASDAVEMIASGSTVTINAGTVIQNNRSTTVAAIWMTNGGVFVMNGGTIQNCSSPEGGALFSGANNTFTIHGGTIQNCSASSFGGAICLRSGSYTLTIDGGTIQNCYSPKGGAVFVAPFNTTANVGATINFSGGTIKNCNNSAIVSGAAFYVGSRGSGNKITLNLSGGTIDNCDASGTGAYDGGGGVYCELGELTLNMSGTTIKNCDAVRGGGIHVYGITAYITLSGGVIDNCSGSTYGGGAYVNGLTSGSWFKMDNTTAGTTGCEIKNCSSKGHAGGGGLFLYGSNFTATLTKGLVHNCTNADPDNSGAGRGGGVLLDHGITAYINGDNMKIYDNDAGRYGGGVQLANSSTLYFSKGEIYGNEAGDGAAGIHVTGDATLNMSGGKLYGNETPGVGGGIHSSEGCTLNITGGQIYNNIAHSQGGGINLNTRTSLEISAGSTLEMYGNKACRGGAIMVDGGILTIWAGSYHDNQALDSYTPSGSNVQVDTYGTGGAFCLVTANNSNTFASECYLHSGTLNNNSASKHGGAIYIGKTTSVHEDPTQQPGDPEMHILGAATISNNQALDGNGGGIFLETGTFEMTAGTITGNSATQYGGGFYVTTVSGKTLQADISGGSIVSNSADYGGGFAVVGGTCNIKGTGVSIGASGTPNTATYGAGLYAHGGTTTITKGNIQYNEATQDGGGIYADGGSVTVNYGATSDGKIHHNYAGKRGGGLFISSTGHLDLKGKTTLEYNRVPEGELGGGVYLAGTVQAGASSSDVIIVKDNYADNMEGATITKANRNNIYLPNPVDTQTTDVITVVNNGLNLSSSRIGFSVPHNFVPVIYCTTPGYLSPTIMNSDAIFEDSERYTKYYSTTSPYKPNYIYLSADTWFAAVATQPAGFSYDNIDSPEDLAWLISLVNGRTTPSAVTASTLSGTTVTLTADLDMKDHSWVPIGFTGKSFNGTFNGNGHTISNVYCSYLGEGQGGTGSGLGLFGTTDGATIHDVFLQGVELDVRNQTGGTYVMGAIANEAKGGTTIYNCIASSKMESTMANTTMGGLVGTLTSGTVHSSSAMPDMTGYQMGGLAGQTASGGNLYNSFANGKFTAQTGSTRYVGGLVGVNAGRIENCYARIQNGSNPSSDYFGWIAGQNNSGTVTYCYIPTADYGATYVKDGTAAANNCTSFGPTSTPYQYKHADNQMTANGSNGNIVNGALDRNGLKGLLATLNKWVGSSATYSKWMRTSASPINGDYPLHDYTGYVCVCSPNNVGLEYHADFNAKFEDYIRDNRGTVYLYRSPADAVTPSLSNIGKETELYIHEDVAMLHTSAIKAHVGITLDNSAGAGGATPSFGGEDAIDWHFFSSALADAPIGLVYGDQSPYNLGVYPSWHATFTNANGYFPTNLNDVVGSDDYYEHWDLYGYYEPDYHWVNYKRNSASHWHEDWPDIHIPYTNDTEFVPGKGYMVALKDEGYLQAYGTLNTNTGTGSDYISVPVTCTSSIGWTTREGHNLLGNPYQSYLDFEAFVRKNESLWNEGRDPFYIIIDEDNKDYVLYTVRQSPNPKQASRFLHPHQGFMIDCDVTNVSAKFDNSMRATTTTVTTSGSTVTWDGGFRGGEDAPCYPLVNLMATDANGNRDIVTVELGRPDKGGALKQDAMHSGKGSLWCRYEGEDYALVFTQPGLDAANIRFACDEDAEFTMTWSTHNGEFSYLHLIDNMTGADIDCLSESEYTFSARESDYNSRFRLVFDYTGVEENEDGPSTGSGAETFAYYANGEIHLTDADDDASLQIIDMTGRVIVSRDGVHTVSTTGLAAGVYVLRLTTANGTRTQKIILN